MDFAFEKLAKSRGFAWKLPNLPCRGRLGLGEGPLCVIRATCGDRND